MTSTKTSEAVTAEEEVLLRRLLQSSRDNDRGLGADLRALRKLALRQQNVAAVRERAGVLFKPYDPLLAALLSTLEDSNPRVIARWPLQRSFQTTGERMPLLVQCGDNLVAQVTRKAAKDDAAFALELWNTHGSRFGSWTLDEDGRGGPTVIAARGLRLLLGWQSGHVTQVDLAALTPPWSGGDAPLSSQTLARLDDPVVALGFAAGDGQNTRGVAASSRQVVLLSDARPAISCRDRQRPSGRPGSRWKAVCLSEEYGVVLASSGNILAVWHPDTGTQIRRVEDIHQNTIRLLHDHGARKTRRGPQRAAPSGSGRPPGTGLVPHRPDPLLLEAIDTHQALQVTEDGLITVVRLADATVTAAFDCGERLVAASLAKDRLGHDQLVVVGRRRVLRFDRAEIPAAAIAAPTTREAHHSEVAQGYSVVLSDGHCLLGHVRGLFSQEDAHPLHPAGGTLRDALRHPLAARFSQDGAAVAVVYATGLVVVWRPLDNSLSAARWAAEPIDGCGYLPLDEGGLAVVGDLDLHAAPDSTGVMLLLGDVQLELSLQSRGMRGPQLTPLGWSTGSDAQGIGAAVSRGAADQTDPRLTRVLSDGRVLAVRQNGDITLTEADTALVSPLVSTSEEIASLLLMPDLDETSALVTGHGFMWQVVLV